MVGEVVVPSPRGCDRETLRQYLDFHFFFFIFKNSENERKDDLKTATLN